MKYNSKYDRYIDDDLVIYRWSKTKDKLVQCKQHYNNDGYLFVWAKIGVMSVHRLVYETFVGEIPEGYEIDHINTIRTDNRIENLRCVTHKENANNPLSKNRKIGNDYNKGKIRSDFGRKFKEHFGITRFENYKLYDRELHWYKYHNKVCRWEK